MTTRHPTAHPELETAVTTTPLTDQQLDEIEVKAAELRERLDRKNPWPSDNESHWTAEGWKSGTRNALDKLHVEGLVAEVRRLRIDAAAALLPAWEVMYEPGNVSDYLIGYANSEAAAKGAAEAWMRSESEVTGRLEWTPQNPLNGYDCEFEMVQRHDDGVDTGPGIAVRRRAAATQEKHQGKADPSGCRWCGIPEREHVQRWKKPVGWHKWEQPTQEQIKDRMRARRAARTTARLLDCGWCYEEQGEEVHPHPECPIGAAAPAVVVGGVSGSSTR